MAIRLVGLLDTLEPPLSEHEAAFRKAGFNGEFRRLSFVLYTSIALTTLYMFKEAAVPLSRYAYWPLLTVRCFMILIPAALLIVQKKTVEPVLNRPLMLAMAFIIAFNQVLTAFERPFDYSFTSYTSMIVLFIEYFAFPFRLSTRAGISLAMTLADAYVIIGFKTFPVGGKITVLVTYFSFNVIFMYWSASINTMRRKSFMDEALSKRPWQHDLW